MPHPSVSADKRVASGASSMVVAGLCTVMMLSGCVVRVAGPLPPPPPPVAYVPPPPPPPPEPVYTPPPAEDQGEVQASEPPPPLPDYEQPPCPVEGYLWTPGYWAFGPGGYYWVPGTWVEPPRVGLLWTPGYWGFVGAVYVFHAGYWGPHVGFYGGVSYGFGYTGVGFAGGRWVGNGFAYNRSVTNINVTVVHNVYNETVVNNVTVNRVSYNGGAAGIHAVASPQERQWAAEPHVAPTNIQVQHIHQAAGNPALFAKANGGRPSIAATPRPAVFNAPGVVGAHGAASPPARANSFNAPNNNGQRPAFNNGQPQINQPKPPNAPTAPTVARPNGATNTQVHQQVNGGYRPPPKQQPAAKNPPRNPQDKEKKD